MMPDVERLRVATPRSLGEALRLLRAEPGLRPMAGCTDLLVELGAGRLRDEAFLDLSGIAALRGVRRKRSGLVIGALTTFTDLRRSRDVRALAPALALAAREVGGPQIQHRGTLGGNIANGSPAGDSLPVLAVLEASILLASADGERRVPFCELFTGYRATVRRPDELLVAVEVPRVEGTQWFRKVGTRAAQAISKVVMAGLRGPGDVRLALGSVGPTVLRLPQTEAALRGGATLAEARRLLEREIAPVDDVRSTAGYRRRVAGNLLEAFWAETRPRRRARSAGAAGLGRRRRSPRAPRGRRKG